MGLFLKRLAFVALLLPVAGVHAAKFRWNPWAKTCQPELTTTDIHFPDDVAALETAMHGLAALDPNHEQDPAYQQVKYSAVPRMRWDSDLASLILYGGHNEGKTKLLNALPAMFYNYGLPPDQQDPTYGLDKPIADTGWDQVSTRALVAIRESQKDNRVMHDLHERLPGLEYYNGPADASRTDTTTPILYNMPNMPINLSVIDAQNITSGDPRVAQNPFYVAMAERTLVAADVMLVLMDMRTINNPAILDSIRRTFDRYGRKQLVPVLQADASVTHEQAEAALDKFANIVYDRPVDSVGTPEGVVGKYIMPIDPLVSTNQAHVRMIALGDSPEFVELLFMIASNSKGYKEAALRASTESFRMDASRTVREAYKRRMARQIYAEAIEALSFTIASENVVDLDYDNAGRHWRNGIENRRAAPWPVMNRVSEVLGTFERDIPAAWRALRGRGKKGMEELVSEQRLEQLVLYNRQAVTEMQNQLNSRYLNLIPNPDTPNRRAAGDQLKARMDAFLRMFPEERSNEDDCVKMPGRTCVHLPRRELLPSAVRQKLEGTLHTDANALLASVSAVEKASLSPDSPVAKEALNDIKNKRTFKMFLRDFWWDSVTQGGFFTSWLMVHHLAGGGVTGFTAGLVGGHIVARLARSKAEEKRDGTYFPWINHWYRKLQWSTIDRVLRQHLFADVLAMLKVTDDVEAEALDKTQQALRFLDPTLPKFPPKLETTVTYEAPAVSKKK